jgi:hypothetical protein
LGTSTSASSTASTCSDAGTLYTRLGGHAGIRAAVDAIVAAELADPDIKTYFFNQVRTPVPAGHPNAAQIEECFTDLLGSIAGGAEVYPPDGGVTDDAGSTFMCRADLTVIHAPLLISGGTFEKFVTIAAGVLQGLGVSSCDIATVGGALDGTKSAVVTPSLADAGSQPFPGYDGGASDASEQ